MRRVEFHKGEPALSNDGRSGDNRSGDNHPGDNHPGKEYQRRFSRYPFDVRIQVSVFRDGTTTQLWGRTSELGQDGLGATLSGGLQLGEVVSLEFPLPLPPHVAKLRAVVRYSEGLRCGFEFLVVPDEQKLVLRQVCVVLANAS
jgi:hypothetical protein